MLYVDGEKKKKQSNQICYSCQKPLKFKRLFVMENLPEISSFNALFNN